MVHLHPTGGYDYNTVIYTSGSILYFVDDDNTTPGVPFGIGTGGVTDHGALTGLADDDHTQYHNTARHLSAHDASFDNALPISGEVRGNATLGAHLSDSLIHFIQPSNIYAVYADGNGPYATIQAAADAADAVGGGIVVIEPGTYTEQVSLGTDVHLVAGRASGSEQCIITTSSQGAAVLTATGNNIISGVRIENTSTADDMNTIIAYSGYCYVYNCAINQTQGQRAFYCNDSAGFLTMRRTDVIAGSQIIYAKGYTYLRYCFIFGSPTKTEEMFTVRDSGKSWTVEHTSLVSAGTQGAFLFAAGGGILSANNLTCYEGAETLFHPSSSVGTVTGVGIKATELGGNANVTFTPGSILRPKFSGETIISDNTPAVPLTITRTTSGTGGSGRYLEIKDEDANTIAYIDSQGQYHPPVGGAVVYYLMTAEGAELTGTGVSKNKVGTKYLVDYIDGATGRAEWHFYTAQYDGSSTIQAILQYSSPQTTGSVIEFQVGTCDNPDGAVLAPTLTWSSDLPTTPNATANLWTRTQTYELIPDWGADSNVTFALKRVPDANTGTVRVWRPLIIYDRTVY